MKTCKHCKQRVCGSHNCKVANRTVDGDSDFVTDVAESLFGGDSSSCDVGSDSGSCDGD